MNSECFLISVQNEEINMTKSDAITVKYLKGKKQLDHLKEEVTSPLSWCLAISKPPPKKCLKRKKGELWGGICNEVYLRLLK
jgi:hypothetical protein